MTDLAKNLNLITQNIHELCKRLGRPSSDIKILLATKTVSPETLRQVAQMGYVHFGENKAQELTEKIAQLSDLPQLRWDFIGHLQSNKVKDVLGHCQLIHSVDRLSLAQEISKRAQQKNINCQILIEINTSGEVAKSGVSPEMALQLCRDISVLPHIQIQGLMTVAKDSPQAEEVRACFKKLKTVFEHIKNANIPHVKMNELSMGMSQDYLLAIEEGATLLRLGSAVFGSRPSLQ